MSRSRAILDKVVDINQRLEEIQSTDVHGAVLTLTRTTALAITTAGTTITWQSELRGYQITWAGTDITIPSDGWYLLDLTIATSAALNSLEFRLRKNGANSIVQPMLGDIDRTQMHGTITTYLNANDIVTINLIPSANVNVNVNAEGGGLESPIFNIVQISGAVDV